jgi:TolB-like protein/class 3 adenylate cyclase
LLLGGAENMKRKLAAILAADVVGYSRLMGRDEVGTHAALQKHQDELIAPTIASHRGRIVKLMGDGLLAEFASVVDALSAALAIQRAMAERNAGGAADQRIDFRIGINLGDVIAEKDDLFGDGVNIAARLEGLADPGGIAISGTAYDHVKNKLAVGFEFRGEQRVKNVADPIRVYRIALDGARLSPDAKGKSRRLTWIWAAAAAVVLLVASGGFAIWQSWHKRAPDAAAEDVLALPTGPAIAVLPFDNLSGDPSQEYFADGITEDIITKLVQYKEFLVYARNTMFQYKGTPVDIVAFAKRLKADYVVEGSVQRQADSVRISAQLLDAHTGGHVWSDTYDRALTAANILAVQDEIASEISLQIADSHGEINLLETARSERGSPRSMESYDCFLKFLNYERLTSFEAHSTARECLEGAIKKDPDSADSWSALASLYCDEMIGTGPRSESSSFRRAVAAGEKALKLAPRSARAHAALSRALFFAGESQRAREEAETAIALSPNDTEVVSLAVEALTQTGLFQRGYDLLMKLQKLNPNYPDWINYFVFFKYFVERNFVDAVRWIEKARTLETWYWWMAHRAVTYCLLGDLTKGKDLIRQTLASKPDFKQIFWHEMNFFNPHSDSKVRVDLFLEGAAKCGWELPPRPEPGSASVDHGGTAQP